MLPLLYLDGFLLSRAISTSPLRVSVNRSTILFGSSMFNVFIDLSLYGLELTIVFDVLQSDQQLGDFNQPFNSRLSISTVSIIATV